MSNHRKIPKNNYHLIVVLSIIVYILICGALPVGLSIPHYAYAHSLPVTETPAANSIVAKGTPLPSKLTIDFSERPSPAVSSIQVLNSKNEPVNNGDFKIIGDGGREAMTTLDTKKLTDGVYTVSWETQSLDDGHIAERIFCIWNRECWTKCCCINCKWKNITTTINHPIGNFAFRWIGKMAHYSFSRQQLSVAYFLICSYGRILVVR